MSDPIVVPPTPERIAKGDILIVEGTRGGKEARSYADPLDFYLHKGLITEEQHMAGTQFAEVWFRAFHKSHYAQWGYQAPTGRKPLVAGGLTEEMLKYYKLIGNISGVKEIDLVVAVCCYKKKAGKRGGMRYLISGLADLVAYHKKQRK